MNNNQELVNSLVQQGYLKSPGLIKAFEKIDRADFVRPEFLSEAYENYPLSIGAGQTISQPATVALMLELLAVQTGDKVLDVGSGSGWQTALLAQLTGPGGKVIGLEIKAELIAFAKNNLCQYDYQNWELIEADGWQGLPSQAPFDKIIVAAACSEIPQALMDQLKIGGRLVIPVGGAIQSILAIDKVSDDQFNKTVYPGFVFVPLIKF